MGALKLECFTNDSGPAPLSAPLLEDFDTARAQAFADGVKSGAKAASKAFEDEKIRLLSPILESLNDIGFSREEARNAALKSFRPLIEAIVKTVLPDAASRGFSAEVMALAQDAARKSPDENIKIAVPPDAVAPLSAMLSETGAIVTADPDLPDLAAIVTWGAGTDKINLSAALQQINAAVDVFYMAADSLSKTGSNHD